MVGMAVFCALALIVSLLPGIKISFLTFDIKDTIITLGAMTYGVIPGAVISLIVSFFEMILVSTTGPYGFLMNFISSAAFACTATLIYKYRRTLWGAIIGLLSSCAVTTALMMVMNLLITPLYMHVTVDAVKGLIPTLLFPFNLTKTVLNSSLVLILYKPVRRVMHFGKAEFFREENKPSTKNSIFATALGIIMLAASLVVFFVVLKGKFGN
jgi:riboflavin transporter FmnP